MFPEEYAALIGNDSVGVGQISLRIGKNCVKIDDADNSFFNNEQLVATVKAMHHSAWSAKTHGACQDNSATICVITTNTRKPIHQMANSGDHAALQRRFLDIELRKERSRLQSKRSINTEITNKIVINLASKVAIVKKQQYRNGLQEHIDYIRNFIKSFPSFTNAGHHNDETPATSIARSPIKKRGMGLLESKKNHKPQIIIDPDNSFDGDDRYQCSTSPSPYEWVEDLKADEEKSRGRNDVI